MNALTALSDVERAVAYGMGARRAGSMRVPDSDVSAAEDWRIESVPGARYRHIERAGLGRPVREVRAAIVVSATGRLMGLCGVDVRGALRVLAAMLGVTRSTFPRWFRGDVPGGGLWELARLVEVYEAIAQKGG